MAVLLGQEAVEDPSGPANIKIFSIFQFLDAYLPVFQIYPPNRLYGIYRPGSASEHGSNHSVQCSAQLPEPNTNPVRRSEKGCPNRTEPWQLYTAVSTRESAITFPTLKCSPWFILYVRTNRGKSLASSYHVSWGTRSRRWAYTRYHSMQT